MNVVTVFNIVIAILFFSCYAYQIAYIPVSLFGRKFSKMNKTNRPREDISNKEKQLPSETNNYAILICARNEENVIGELIKSIKKQNYPEKSIKIFIVADNCTDRTAELARSKGAYVWERFNEQKKGKGYALEFLLTKIDLAFKLDSFDGFLVLDADNILDENFLYEMNETFCSGYEIITSYRNSKNYADNWISAGYSLWFLREARYLNEARMNLGTSCAVSGTGFMFSRNILRSCGGWPFHLLTEDIEFTVHNVIGGKTIGYCRKAILYDEQPVTFSQSWRQRMRWARGYLQVFGKYGKSLVSGIAGKSFSCFDMTMTIMPAIVLTLLCMSVNTAFGVFSLISGTSPIELILPSIFNVLRLYFGLFFIGAITTATEWHSIHASIRHKIIYTFTFPIFMLTYIPISVAAMFKRVEWQPITHSRAVNLDQIRRRNICLPD